MKNFKKGFTLIELLVVVAIIGILASVVLASLNSARNKGKDAAVKSQLSSMRGQAEIFYSSATPTYSGVCAATQANNGFGGTTGPGLLKATADANAVTLTSPAIVVVAATQGVFNTVTCHDSAGAWAAEAPLFGSATGAPVMYCVDSTGLAKQETDLLGASDYTCTP